MAMTEVAPDVDTVPLKQISTHLPNIQGNVFGGFFKDHQVFLFLRINDTEQAKAWLADLIDDIATAEEVIAFNNAFKLTRKRHHRREGVVKATWVNVAFTFKGLKALDVSPDETFPDEYKRGMAAQAAVIGDVDDSAPSNWIPPLQVTTPLDDPNISDDPNTPDAILLIASDDPEDLEAEVERLAQNLDIYDIEVIYRQDGESRSGIENGEDQRGHEHFGFDDGVSQPGVRDDRVTPPGASEDVGLPGQDRMWPGEWVLGYPRQIDDKPDHSLNTNPGPKDFKEPVWAEDGSYLVFRRLRQDVKGFRDFVDNQAAVEGITPSVMGAKIVGRYTSGCPLEIADGEADTFDPTASDPSKADATRLDDQHINAFEYKSENSLRNDEDGHRVPRAAHIRKVYPRNEVPPNEGASQIRRILRRGIQFGKSFDAYADPDSPTGADAAFPDDRGLCFLCYQGSIKDKFEFLMRFWVNNENFPQVVGGVKDGHDLVISQASAIRHFNLPGGVQPAITAPARWVITSGGGYFFQPSISGLQHLAGLV